MDKKISDHFKKADPVLHAVSKKIAYLEKYSPGSADDFFRSLCEDIIGQQLSGKAADTIYSRFEKLFAGKKITPEKVLALPADKLKAAGMSRAKVKYVKDLAQKVKNKTLKLAKLDQLSDYEVIAELTKVKGIGPWTAEMFLMFTLGREDVFSFGDLGLRKAITRLYKFKQEPGRRQMEKLVKKWKPYRTFASRILWKYLELD